MSDGKNAKIEKFVTDLSAELQKEVSKRMNHLVLSMYSNETEIVGDYKKGIHHSDDKISQLEVIEPDNALVKFLERKWQQRNQKSKSGLKGE